MKLEIALKVRYPETPPTEGRTYATQNIHDCYEQVTEVENETQAQAIVAKVIKAFNGFE